MDYILILAGGTGSRFWPLSRELEPKQFLNLCSARPMLDECLSKISGLVPKKNIYIAANKIHAQKIKNCLKDSGIPAENIIFEPAGKNTLAPIAFLAYRINAVDPYARLIVLPCDHFVRNNKKFLGVLTKGLAIAERGHIVTLGFKPTRPETGYGYIKTKLRAKGYYLIDRFIEKPALWRAIRFIRDKRYYWNAGVFIFKPLLMLKEIRKFKPQAYAAIARMKNPLPEYKLWQQLPSVSIDYAVMEKTKKGVLLPADYGWIDLGSWQAVAEISRKDKNGNTFKGNCLDIGSKNTLSWSSGRLVATLGLENIVIVDTQDALLVCAKDRTQDVKKIIRILKRNKLKRQI